MTDLERKAREAAQAVGGPCWAGTEIFSMGYLAAAEPREELIAELVKELTRARELVRLVTIRQVIDAGNNAIEAAGLNPWCLSEGLADGSERVSVWSIDAALAKAEARK